MRLLCTLEGWRWPREAPPLLDGRQRRRSQRGRRVERLVVVVTAGSAFDGRVHVVAEERPGAPDVDAEREECTQYDNDAKVTVALRPGATEHEHEAPRDGAHIAARAWFEKRLSRRLFLRPASMVVAKVSQSKFFA